MSKAAITKSGIPANVGMESRRAGRRGDDRTNTTGHLVKVEHEHDEGLARCHNVSDGGMAISAVIPLDLNDCVTITISLVELRGRVVWINGRDCGIAFDHPIDSAHVLRNAAAGRPACRGLADAISVRGMKVTNDSNFRPGLKVRVILDSGLEKDGIIHWSQDNIAGVTLLSDFDFIRPGSLYRLNSPA